MTQALPDERRVELQLDPAEASHPVWGPVFITMSPGFALATGLKDAPLQVNKFLSVLRLDCSPSQVLSKSDSLSVHGEPCGTEWYSLIPYVILMLLMGFTTYYQQRQMTASRGPADPQAQQMQSFMKILPLMLLFFSYTFPSGLTLYWLTTNVWTIGQQRLMLKAVPPIQPGKKRPAGESEASGDGKPGGKPGKKAAARDPAKTNPGKQQGAAKPHPSSKKRKKR